MNVSLQKSIIKQLDTALVCRRGALDYCELMNVSLQKSIFKQFVKGFSLERNALYNILLIPWRQTAYIPHRLSLISFSNKRLVLTSLHHTVSIGVCTHTHAHG